MAYECDQLTFVKQAHVLAEGMKKKPVEAAGQTVALLGVGLLRKSFCQLLLHAGENTLCGIKSYWHELKERATEFVTRGTCCLRRILLRELSSFWKQESAMVLVGMPVSGSSLSFSCSSFSLQSRKSSHICIKATNFNTCSTSKLYCTDGVSEQSQEFSK